MPGVHQGTRSMTTAPNALHEDDDAWMRLSSDSFTNLRTYQLDYDSIRNGTRCLPFRSVHWRIEVLRLEPLCWKRSAKMIDREPPLTMYHERLVWTKAKTRNPTKKGLTQAKPYGWNLLTRPRWWT